MDIYSLFTHKTGLYDFGAISTEKGGKYACFGKFPNICSHIGGEIN